MAHFKKLFKNLFVPMIAFYNFLLKSFKYGNIPNPMTIDITNGHTKWYPKNP